MVSYMNFDYLSLQCLQAVSKAAELLLNPDAPAIPSPGQAFGYEEDAQGVLHRHKPQPETRHSARPYSPVPVRQITSRVCKWMCTQWKRYTSNGVLWECVRSDVSINRRASNAPLLYIISAGPISITNDRCIVLKSHKAQHSSILLSGPKTLGNYSLRYISIFTYNNAADAGLSFNQIIFHLPLSCQLPLEGEELFIKAHGHPSWGISVSLSRLRFCLLITHIPPIPTLSSAHFLHFSTLYLG